MNEQPNRVSRRSAVCRTVLALAYADFGENDIEAVPARDQLFLIDAWTIFVQ